MEHLSLRRNLFTTIFHTPRHKYGKISCLKGDRATVVLTREAGSNGKLLEMLETRGIDTIELPMIKYNTRPETKALVEFLRKRLPDWIILTSPQAARVFLRSWETANCPLVKIATFKGTQAVLESSPSAHLKVQFVSEVAKGEHLAQTLPKSDNIALEEVLYPASSKADDTVERGLRRRHFTVTRMDTYETTSVFLDELDQHDLATALKADIVTFASPTAVSAWKDANGVNCNLKQPVACIGSTTAKRAHDVGFANVYFAENPGIDGLMHSVESILQELGKSITKVSKTHV